MGANKYWFRVPETGAVKPETLLGRDVPRTIPSLLLSSLELSDTTIFEP